MLIEEWLRSSDGCPRVCAERLRRLASGRASNGWPEACFLARDVADALLTGAMKVRIRIHYMPFFNCLAGAFSVLRAVLTILIYTE